MALLVVLLIKIVLLELTGMEMPVCQNLTVLPERNGMELPVLLLLPIVSPAHTGMDRHVFPMVMDLTVLLELTGTAQPVFKENVPSIVHPEPPGMERPVSLQPPTVLQVHTGTAQLAHLTNKIVLKVKNGTVLFACQSAQVDNTGTVQPATVNLVNTGTVLNAQPAKGVNSGHQ